MSDTKKVYLVSDADIDSIDYNVAVFTTHEAAEQFADALNKKHFRGGFGVTELPLDPPISEAP